MSYTYPYVPNVVTDGVDDALANDHNRQGEQIEALTELVNNFKNQKVVAAWTPSGAPLQPGGVCDVLTNVALDTAKTLKVSIGASGLFNLTSWNVAGPAGSGIPTLVQRFTAPSATVMGIRTGSGEGTQVKITLYENSEIVGWIDLVVVVP